MFYTDIDEKFEREQSYLWDERETGIIYCYENDDYICERNCFGCTYVELKQAYCSCCRALVDIKDVYVLNDQPYCKYCAYCDDCEDCEGTPAMCAVCEKIENYRYNPDN